MCPAVSAFDFAVYVNQTCAKFISGSAAQGLHTVTVRFEEDLRTSLAAYQTSDKSPTAIKTLVASSVLLELFEIQRFIVEGQISGLVAVLQASIQSQIQVGLEERLAVFCLFVVLLLLLFVIVWLPFVNSMASEIHQTKKVLLIVPLEILVNMRNVSQLLNAKAGGKQSEAKP